VILSHGCVLSVALNYSLFITVIFILKYFSYFHNDVRPDVFSYTIWASLSIYLNSLKGNNNALYWLFIKYQPLSRLKIKYLFSEKTGFKLDQHKILVRLKLYSQSPKLSPTNFLNNSKIYLKSTYFGG